MLKVHYTALASSIAIPWPRIHPHRWPPLCPRPPFLAYRPPLMANKPPTMAYRPQAFQILPTHSGISRFIIITKKHYHSHNRAQCFR